MALALLGVGLPSVLPSDFARDEPDPETQDVAAEWEDGEGIATGAGDDRTSASAYCADILGNDGNDTISGSIRDRRFLCAVTATIYSR